MARSSAFHEDRGGGASFGAGGEAGTSAGDILGAHYDGGDHAVVARCSPHCFPGAFWRDAVGSGFWRDCGELFWTALPCIRYWCFPAGAALRGSPPRSKRIPVCRHYAGDCAAGTADAPGVGSRFSSVRRSFYRNCGGADICVGVAREGTYILRINMNSSSFPRRG
jgi:hypothetical protein